MAESLALAGALAAAVAALVFLRLSKGHDGPAAGERSARSASLHAPAADPGAARRRSLGGREFRLVEVSTLGHDIALLRAARAAGLTEIQPLGSAENPADFFIRAYQRALFSDAYFELLGTLWIPAAVADQDWTPEIGAETAAFLRGLTDEADKFQVHGALQDICAFFVLGRLSWDATAIASAQEIAAAAAISNSPPRPA